MEREPNQVTDENEVISPDQPVTNEEDQMFTTQAIDEDGAEMRATDISEESNQPAEISTTQAVTDDTAGSSISGSNLMVIGGILLLVVLVAVLLFNKFKKA